MRKSQFLPGTEVKGKIEGTSRRGGGGRQRRQL
jgi:hypothetical protein